MKLTRVAFAVVSVGLMGAAHGQPSGWYGGFSVGRSQTDMDKAGTDAALASAGIGGISSSVKDNDTGYKIRLGYQFSPNWAVEGGYVDFGKFKYNASFTTPVAGTASGDIEASGWNLDARGSLPMGERFSAFGKVGLMYSTAEANVSISAGGVGASDRAKARKTVPGLGLGVEYAATKAFALRAEWERYFRLGNADTGEGDVDLLSVGLDLRF